MISSKVTSEEELRKALEKEGFVPTEERTKTGTFWRHIRSGLHVEVPRSIQGFYPDWLLSDLYEQIGRLHLWEKFKPRTH